MFDLPNLIQTVGYLGLFGIVFAESGLFIGFFLPGDSLLFTAGFLAAQGHLDLMLAMLVIFVGAVLGDNFGYAFGRNIGPGLFNREKSLLFHKSYLARAQHFYAQHGGKAIILARFIPVIRTFAPILAGVGKMNYGQFIAYNLVGGLLWSISIPLLGFYLGTVIPDIDRYLVPAILVIIAFSLLPSLIHVLKDPHHRRQLATWFQGWTKNKQRKVRKEQP